MIVFDHLRLDFNMVNTILMCKIGVIYYNASRAVCAYALDFWKLPGCALIGACVLI